EELQDKRQEAIRQWRDRGRDSLEQRKNQHAYDSAVRRAAELGLEVHGSLADVMANHPRMPRLVEHFATRPAELRAINRAADENPAKGAAMLGELAARFTDPPP